MDNKVSIENALGRLIYIAERSLVNRLQRNFRSSGYAITAEQWRVLITLWNQDGQTQQELAEKTVKDKGNITRLINILKKAAWLFEYPIMRMVVANLYI